MESVNVSIVALAGRDALTFHEILDRADEIAVLGSRLVLLLTGCTVHPPPQGTRKISLTTFQEELHITHGFRIDLGAGKVANARSETTLDVVLQTWARVIPR